MDVVLLFSRCLQETLLQFGDFRSEIVNAYRAELEQWHRN